jgi:flavin-dependent dehydrogenase
MSAPQVIVIGGGLAGLTAAHTVLENGGRVCLIDKAREGLRSNLLQPHKHFISSEAAAVDGCLLQLFPSFTPTPICRPPFGGRLEKDSLISM